MLRVLYNGECPVCSLEIKQYQKYTWNNLIDVEFENLHETDMLPWGVTQDEAKRRLHVMTEDGVVLSGVDAFEELWSRMPRYERLSRITRMPGIDKLSRGVYDNILAPVLYHKNKLKEQLWKTNK